MGKHTSRTDTEIEKHGAIQAHCAPNPQRKTRNLPNGVANSVMERNFLWLRVDHNRLNDTRNQSSPICKRNKCN